jgi:hypothetical protein
MKIDKFIIALLIVYPLIVKGQDGCKTRKPVNLDILAFNSNNTLTCDRFHHTLSPKITKLKRVQIEAALTLRDEFYKGEDFNKSKSTTFNVYSTFKIKYAFANNFDINLIFNELILYSGEEIEEYGGENPYSRYSLGTKYVFFRSNNYKNIVGLWGQLSFFKEDNHFILYPELKILFLKELFQKINVTFNIGGAFIAKNTISLIYAIELKILMTKKFELIVENYNDYIHLNSIGKPSNRFLLGCGTFIHEDFYMYLTYEKGIMNSDYLNYGKMDLGFAYIF